MISPRLRRADLGLVAVALLGAAFSFGWFWLQQSGLRKIKAESISAVAAGASYVPTDWPVPPTGQSEWSPAPAQSRGRDWRYDLFAPPTITYDRAQRRFGVVAPVPVSAQREATAAVQLIQVKPELFRLQLLGAFGGPKDLLGAFAGSDSPETLLVRAGHNFDSLGLTLVALGWRKFPAGEREPGAGEEIGACAILRDTSTGEEMVLDSRSRKVTGRFVALFQTAGGADQPRELREGDSLSTGEFTYRVEQIRDNPPEVELARVEIGRLVAEKRVLRPVGQSPGRASLPAPFAHPARAAVTATNP